MDGRGSFLGRCKRFLSSPKRLDWLWDPFSLLSSVYRRLFTWGESGRDVKLQTRLHLVPRSRMLELYLLSSTLLHGMILN
jgi:hypothetical protein